MQQCDLASRPRPYSASDRPSQYVSPVEHLNAYSFPPAPRSADGTQTFPLQPISVAAPAPRLSRPPPPRLPPGFGPFVAADGDDTRFSFQPPLLSHFLAPEQDDDDRYEQFRRDHDPVPDHHVRYEPRRFEVQTTTTTSDERVTRYRFDHVRSREITAPPHSHSGFSTLGQAVYDGRDARQVLSSFSFSKLLVAPPRSVARHRIPRGPVPPPPPLPAPTSRSRQPRSPLAPPVSSRPRSRGRLAPDRLTTDPLRDTQSPSSSPAALQRFNQRADGAATTTATRHEYSFPSPIFHGEAGSALPPIRLHARDDDDGEFARRGTVDPDRAEISGRERAHDLCTGEFRPPSVPRSSCRNEGADRGEARSGLRQLLNPPSDADATRSSPSPSSSTASLSNTVQFAPPRPLPPRPRPDRLESFPSSTSAATVARGSRPKATDTAPKRRRREASSSHGGLLLFRPSPQSMLAPEAVRDAAMSQPWLKNKLFGGGGGETSSPSSSSSSSSSTPPSGVSAREGGGRESSKCAAAAGHQRRGGGAWNAPTIPVGIDFDQLPTKASRGRKPPTVTNAVAAAAVEKTGGGDERVDAGPSTATKSDRGGSSSQHEETHPDHARERDKVATEAARGTGRRREGNGKRRGEKNGTRDKRFVCPVKECGKMFRRGEHLQRHIRSIHTGEKPFQCQWPGCGKYFSRHDNLNQHLRVHKSPEQTKEEFSAQVAACFNRRLQEVERESREILEQVHAARAAVALERERADAAASGRRREREQEESIYAPPPARGPLVSATTKVASTTTARGATKTAAAAAAIAKRPRSGQIGEEEEEGNVEQHDSDTRQRERGGPERPDEADRGDKRRKTTSCSPQPDTNGEASPVRGREGGDAEEGT